MRKGFLAMITAALIAAGTCMAAFGAVKDMEGKEFEDGFYDVSGSFQSIEDNTVYVDVDDNGTIRTIHLGAEYESLATVWTYRIKIEGDDDIKVFGFEIPDDVVR